MNENYTGSNQAIPEGMAMRNMQSARPAQMNHEFGGAQHTMSADLTARAAGYTPGLTSGKIGEVRDKGEIEQQIDALDNQLKSLHYASVQISERFSTVLSDSTSINQAKTKDQSPMYTQLGSRLSILNANAAQLRESLQDIIDRCKL